MASPSAQLPSQPQIPRHGAGAASTLSSSAALLPLEAWQEELRRAYRSPQELLADLSLPESLAPIHSPLAFPFLVPRPFAARMRPGLSDDPLLLQVLPHRDEFAGAPTGSLDPVGDGHSRKAPGLLQKYAGRALLLASGACAVHCRYCFRQNYPYGDEPRTASQWELALEHLRRDSTIGEAVLSGGDPLSLPRIPLERLVRALEDIPHLHTLRIHTRLPIVLPARVDDVLESLLGSTRLRVVVVLHVNHAQEIDDFVVAAVRRLAIARCTLLAQSVLLARINDSVEALTDLSLALWQAGILPYYLHQLDHVRGSQRFEVSDDCACRLVDALRSRLPGYLVPRLVREIAGAPSKTPLPSAPCIDS